MGLLIFFLCIAGAVGVALAAYFLKKRRRNGFASFARQFGLEYSPVDPFGLVGLPFALFNRGDGQGVENVLWGQWHGTDVTAFDFSYYEEESTSNGARTKTYHRFECVVTEIDAVCSPLSIEPENLFTRIADGLGFHDIEFESDEFNRAFNVKSKDRKFGSAFVDARIMRWLLADARGCTFEVCGKWLLVATGRLRPSELVPLVGTAKAFRDQVPGVVYSLYGTRASSPS